MQSSDSAAAQAQCAAEVATSMARAVAEQQQYQVQAAYFQSQHGSNVSADVCAGQKGQAGGGGPMRYPDAMTKE